MKVKIRKSLGRWHVTRYNIWFWSYRDWNIAIQVADDLATGKIDFGDNGAEYERFP